MNIGLARVTIGNFVSTALGAIFWFILASVLNVDNYGEVSYLLSLGYFFAPIALLGMAPSLMTYLPKGDLQFASQARTLVLISSTAIGIGLVFVDPLLSLLLISYAFYHMSITELLGLRKYKEYMILTISSNASRIALSILLFFALGIDGIIIGYITSQFAFSFRYVASLRHLLLKFDIIRLRLRFLGINYAASVAQNATVYLDKIIVGYFFGFLTLGNYQLGYQIFLGLSLLPVTLYQYLLPYESLGEIKRRIKLLGITTSIIIAVAMYCILPLIITTLFPQFEGAIEFSRILTLTLVPLTVVQILTAMFIGKGTNMPSLIGTILYAVVLVVLLIMLGNTFQIVGLALAVLFATGTQACFLLVESRRYRLKSSQ
ncbi:lipopolysaccharide biosynthesis protein [Candidatus Nitrososphaera sp. FF02]|uniref:lipopolysaccharide biosynthesis protein n=1 Tax=Candidatus Nitrososphaera sp. FF02 TaxID=3398226 RepID=UPI0039EA3652